MGLGERLVGGLAAGGRILLAIGAADEARVAHLRKAKLQFEGREASPKDEISGQVSLPYSDWDRGWTT